MACSLCQPTTLPTLWEDNFCRVVLTNDIDYPAYCRVELIAHIKEMTDLASNDRAKTMKVVFAVESAIREIIQPDKVNLASLGNQTPHIHWHVIPRFENDKHFPNSHWGKTVKAHAARDLSATEIEALQAKVQSYIECALSAH